MLLASMKLRIINFIIDFSIIILICILLFYAFAKAIFLFGLNNLIPDGKIISIDTLLLIVMALYYLLFESLANKTIAKYLTKTRVVNRTGDKPTFLQIVARTFIRTIVPLDLLTFIYGAKGWHDRYSFTEVIREI